VSARIPEGMKLWGFCLLVLTAIAYDTVVRIVLTGLMIASGWWLLKLATRWLLGLRGTEAKTVASEKALEIVPTSCVFTDRR
jgi:hypothetical protein